MKYDDKLTEEDGVYIQAAVLFTSCSGQRRLRVVNLALNTGSSMAEMYRNCKYTIMTTLRFLINVHARLLFSCLFPSCTVLFRTACLLIFDKFRNP